MPSPPYPSFHGYAVLFGKADAVRDIVLPGAFSRSLQNRPPRHVKMLLQHNPAHVIGLWHSLHEDRTGLYVEGIIIPTATHAQGLIELIQTRALDGLSIGYRTIRASRNNTTKTRLLREIDLWEISIVTFPMMQDARLSPRPFYPHR